MSVLSRVYNLRASELIVAFRTEKVRQLSFHEDSASLTKISQLLYRITRLAFETTGTRSLRHTHTVLVVHPFIRFADPLRFSRGNDRNGHYLSHPLSDDHGQWRHVRL